MFTIKTNERVNLGLFGRGNDGSIEYVCHVGDRILNVLRTGRDPFPQHFFFQCEQHLNTTWLLPAQVIGRLIKRIITGDEPHSFLFCQLNKLG